MIALWIIALILTGAVCHYGGKRARDCEIIEVYRQDPLAVELWLAKGAMKQIKSENEDS